MAKVDSTSCFYVYVHRRDTDGRVFYVGKGKAKRAWASQGRSNYWHRIVAKHGLIVEIVQDHLQECYAFELEKDLIAYYGRENLCNLTDGGEGPSGFLKSAETKRKISISKIGKIRMDMRGDNAIVKRPGVLEKIKESRKNLSYDWMKGDKNISKRPEVAIKQSIALKGVPKSLDHRRKLSEANMGKKCPHQAGANNSQAKAVICIDTGVKYSTMKEAVQWLKSIGHDKASDAPISRCCKGMYEYGYKMKWAWE
jgi:hypothetical protein